MSNHMLRTSLIRLASTNPELRLLLLPLLKQSAASDPRHKFTVSGSDKKKVSIYLTVHVKDNPTDTEYTDKKAGPMGFELETDDSPKSIASQLRQLAKVVVQLSEQYNGDIQIGLDIK